LVLLGEAVWRRILVADVPLLTTLQVLLWIALVVAVLLHGTLAVLLWKTLAVL